MSSTTAIADKLAAARTGIEVDRILREAGIPEPKASGCGHCDFGSGSRGMDRCSRCDGTGSVFIQAGATFPNTEEGYLEAVRAMIKIPG